ncbi:MAG: ABC transporter permease [Nocardioidaceae bacterium]
MRRSTQGGLLLVVIILWVVFAISARSFLSSFNLFTLSRDVAVFTMTGFAQMVVLATRQLNLAVGSIAGVAAICSGFLMQSAGVAVPLAVVSALALAGFLGWVNGFLVVRTGINSFIITLAMASVIFGAMVLITKAQAYNQLPSAFTGLGKRGYGWVSILLLVTLVVTALLFLLFRDSLLGRYLLAVGANERAARASGVPVARVIQIAHALSGLLAGLAGVMASAKLSSAIPSLGTDYVLPSFLAPILGGTLLSGGEVAVLGTLLGGILVETITDGLNLLQVNGFWVQLFQGLILLAAVVLDRLRHVLISRARLGEATTPNSGARSP